MTERIVVEQMIRDLHAARVAGDLQAVCRLFAEHGSYRISGASADKPISISADGIGALRPWLSMMLKVFRLSDYELDSLVIEGSRGVAQCGGSNSDLRSPGLRSPPSW